MTETQPGVAEAVRKLYCSHKKERLSPCVSQPCRRVVTSGAQLCPHDHVPASPLHHPAVGLSFWVGSPLPMPRVGGLSCRMCYLLELSVSFLVMPLNFSLWPRAPGKLVFTLLAMLRGRRGSFGARGKHRPSCPNFANVKLGHWIQDVTAWSLQGHFKFRAIRHDRYCPNKDLFYFLRKNGVKNNCNCLFPMATSGCV